MPFYQLNKNLQQELVPGFKANFVTSKNMTLAYWDIQKGSVLPEHSHPHEQVANLIEGTFELTIDGESKVLAPGMVAVIPSNAVHSGKAITDCRIIDVFYPVREEYR